MINLYLSHIRKFYLLLIFLSMFFITNAQITISYPTPASGLTRGLSSGTLTVQVGFTAACTGNAITVALPPSVLYIAGSVTQTGTTITGSSITENNISNLNAPVFNLNGITNAGNITFTIKRQAGCGSLASGKDTVKVTGSCGSSIENDPNINTYNILSPVLSILPPPAINNANVGDNFNRNITIINGGNGCTDTVYFYTVQPAGILTNSTTVGGSPLTAYATNSDTSFYKISGTQLSPDGLLCNGENIIITTNVTVENCSNTTTLYNASTSGRCTGESAAASTIININASQPLLTGSSSATDLIVCTGGTRIFTYVIKNTGAAKAYNINFPVLGNTSVSLTGAYYDTASLMLTLPGVNGGAPFHPSLAGLPPASFGSSLGCSAGQPDRVLNLSLPSNFSLAPGDSLVVQITGVVCTSTTCGSGQFGGDGVSRFSWNYTDQCGNIYPQGTTNILPSFVGIRVDQLASQSPAEAVTAGSCFNYEINALFTGTTIDGYREVKIVVPHGTTLNTVTDQYGNVPLAGYPVQVGDTITLRYAPVIYPDPNTSIALKYNLCTALTGGACGDVTITSQVTSVYDNTCANPLIAVQCTNDGLLYLCPLACADGGVGAINFVYQRSTFGLPDNDNDGQPDASGATDLTKIELDHYRPADIMSTHYVGTVSTTSANPSWAYMFSEWDFTSGVWQPQGTATIILWKSGAPLFTFSGVAITDISSGAGTNFSADWSTQLAAANPSFVYTNLTVDSVVVNASFKYIATVTPYNAEELYIQSSIAPVSSNINGQLTQSVYTAQANPAVDHFSCNNILYNYYLASDNPFFGFNTSDPINLVSGCGTSDLYYALGTVVNGTDPYRYFPYEYRPLAIPDTVIMNVPAGWNLNSTYAVETYSTTAFGEVLNQSIALAPYTHITGNNTSGWQILVDFKSAYAAGNVMANASEAYTIQLHLVVEPTCAAPDSITANATEAGHLIDYPDVVNPLSFNLSLTPDNMALFQYNSTQRPVISLQNNTGVVQGVTPEENWDVQINNSGSFGAPNLWIALEDGGSPVNVDSVVLKPSNIVLIPSTYGSGNKFYKISVAGLGAGTNQQARIYFKYTNCTADSIKMLTGYGCDSFPSNPSTACNSAFQYLKVIPAISQVQLSVAQQPGNGSPTSLCSTDSVLVIVNSAQAGNLVSPYVNVFPPAGLTIQAPVLIEYPVGSGNYQTAALTAISGGFKIDLTSDTAIGANGLPGTILNPGTAGRQAKLKINYTTACGITSGLPLTFSAHGSETCGGDAIGNGSVTQTAGVTIIGATNAGTAGLSISSPVSSLICGQSATLALSAISVTNATQPGDTVIYTLPAGVNYNGNFVTGHNCTGCSVTTAPGNEGATIVEVALQTAVIAGDSLKYSFDITAWGTGCGPVNIQGALKRTIPALTCGVISCAGSSAIIGTTSSGTININKPVLSTNDFSFIQDGATSPSTVSYSFNIANSGTADAAAGAYQVKIYCGINNSGNVLATFTTNAVSIGQTIAQTGTFTFNSPADCSNGTALFVQIQDTAADGTKTCMCSSPAGTASAVALPVTVTSFTGLYVPNKVQLKWSVSNESGIKNYTVERSIDGTTFTHVNNVTAINNQLQNNYTTADDNLPAGIDVLYYRLKINMQNGSNSYYKTITVKLNVASTLQVVPNPARNYIIITFTGNQNDNGFISIIDATGRVTNRYNKSIQNGINSFELTALDRLPNGMYIVSVDDGAKIQYAKLIINR